MSKLNREKEAIAFRDENGLGAEEPVKINADDVYNVGGGFMIDSQLRNVKLGSKIKIEFTETKPSKTKGYNPMKVKKVFVNGKMDEEWLKEQEEAVKDNGDW